MDLNLPIMGASDTPIYKQVFDGIAAQILCGSLPGGTCLPPIRTIAAQLGISVINKTRLGRVGTQRTYNDECRARLLCCAADRAKAK